MTRGRASSDPSVETITPKPVICGVRKVGLSLPQPTKFYLDDTDKFRWKGEVYLFSRKKIISKTPQVLFFPP